MNLSLEKKIDKLFENVGDMALKRRGIRMMQELELKDGDIILDAGCGDGFYLHTLYNLGKFKLTGIDYARKALESAKKNLEKTRGIKIIHGSVQDLPFKDKTFDKIILTEVAEHLPSDLKGLREIYRVLKPGGILVLTVPNHNYPFLWDPVNKLLEMITGKHIKSGFWAGIWNQHIRLYYPKEIRAKIERTNFRIESVECLGHYCLPFNHHLLNIAARLLYGGKMNPQIAQDISKFTAKKKKKKNYIDYAFKLVNWVDHFNEGVVDKSSVSVFVKARK